MRPPITNVAYGLTNALQKLSPQPIVSPRFPSGRDRAEIGTIWVDTTNNDYYVATSVVAGVTNWEAQSTGSGTFPTVTINGGVGTVLTVAASGNTLLGGDLTVTGNSFISATDILGNLVTTGGDVTISNDATTANIDIGTGASTKIVTLGSLSAASRTIIQASSAGIELDSSGNVFMFPAALTTASTSPTLNKRVGSIRITGLTTAATATEIITISNSIITTTSAIFCSVTSLNASTNDALMQINGLVQSTGQLIVSLDNIGLGALGAGDDVRINLWVLN